MLPLNQVVEGDCLAVMREFPDESVDFVMTSPPYWGLRNYGEATETVWGGDSDCKHEWVEERMTLVHENRNFSAGTQEEVHGEKPTTYIKKYDDQVAGFCVKCGAWKGQLGLEPSWQLYVSHMVLVCRELKRVLKKTGSIYIVLGDTYASHTCKRSGQFGKPIKEGFDDIFMENRPKQSGYQEKCLMGIPWRLAFALIEDGWILRNDIIWHKPNAMPSSVKDRLTQTYEHIFHFVKNRKYYYDLDAIREPHKSAKEMRKYYEEPKLKKAKRFRRRESYFQIVPVEAPHRGSKDVIGRYENPAKFNLRVRDVKRGKKGLYVEGGKVKQLKASDQEVENYVYPEGLTKHDVAVRRFPTVNREGGLGYTDPLHVKAYHEKGKNPGDVLAYDSKYAKHEYGQTLQAFVREQTIAKRRQVSRIEAKKLFPNDPEKQQEYINYIHDHDGHPKGKNPGDVFQTKKEPYVGNNPHRMRLQKEQYLALDSSRPMDLSHPKGKNPGDVVVPKSWGVDSYGEYHGHAIKDYESARAQNPSEVKRRIIESFKKKPKGRNPGDFWNVCTKPFKGAHFAVYPEAICVNPILSSCPPNGVVLDPMCGSGTTLVVAKKLGRNFVGIEINPVYVEMARKRLEAVPPRLDTFL